MARLAMFGAESAHAHSEGHVSSGSAVAYDTSVVRSGVRAFKTDGGAAGTTQQLASYVFTGVLGVAYYLTLWMYIPSGSGYPTTAFAALRFLTGGATNLSEIRLQTSGALQLYRGATAIGSPTAALSMDTWHRVDLMTDIDTGAVDAFAGRVDGTIFASASGVTASDTAVGLARWGTGTAPGVNKVYYFDDVVLNDDTGSAHNTYPGDEKVVLLLPTADSSRDAGWLAGGGATTSLFETVNNTPPVGVALASATNTSQIKNAVSTTTEAYSATMKTYTAAGIGGGDTVTAIQAIATIGTSTAAAITAGIAVTSNPAIAEVTPSTAALAAGTYTTNWIRGVTAMSENPSVTLGTAPVMRIRKNVANTTSTMSCFMGMYVSYTVGTPPAGGTRLRFILSLLIAWLRRVRRMLWPPLRSTCRMPLCPTWSMRSRSGVGMTP